MTFSRRKHTIKRKSWESMVVDDLFAVLEEKLEAALRKFEALKKQNAELDQALASKDQALKEAEAALAKITREREVIRQRLDNILTKLKVLELGD